MVALRRPAARRRPGPAAVGAQRRRRRCRTRAASWPRCCSPARRWRARTPPGWTCAPDPAARPGCWPPSGRTGVHLTAADRAPHRAELVRQAVAGVPDVEVLAADGTQPPWAPGSFDRVLLDAPCTGLGALRRRPEVRWRRTADDVPPLVELQTALLDSALRSVRVGGVVAYVTCSPHAAETVGVVDAAAARDDVEVHPRGAAVPGGAGHGARRLRAAVAAPPRHRRDVHGAAPPHPLEPSPDEDRQDAQADGDHEEGQHRPEKPPPAHPALPSGQARHLTSGARRIGHPAPCGRVEAPHGAAPAPLPRRRGRERSARPSPDGRPTAQRPARRPNSSSHHRNQTI